MLHESEEDGTRHDAERCDEETDEIVTGKIRQDRFLEKEGNEGGTEEQQDVEEETHADVEPEDSVVILSGGFSLVGQGSHKTAVLQRVGNQREDGEHANQTIVALIEFTCQDDAKHSIQHLHGTTVQGSPEETLCRFRFQIS